MKKMRIKKRIKRVDVQVSIMSLLVTIFCTVCAYFLGYTLTYNDMLKALNDRVNAIYGFLEDNLDKDIYWDVNGRDDMNKNSYVEMKELLEQVKKTTDVRYLYTATQNADGNFIYVIDGLPSDAGDFRCPGDLIEEEIRGEMNRAMNGETVLPQKIKKTEWGKVFVTYFPIHDGNKVAGVLGIEIEAEHQYDTYEKMKFAIPVIVLVTGILSTVASVVIFRRISNPSYQDMANTDHLTRLKNRNAFETDLHNLDGKRSKKGLGILVADLNGLKAVNDRLGHAVGDLYIKAAAEAIRKSVPKEYGAYRLGGDEFIVLLQETGEKEILRIVDEINRRLEEASHQVTEEMPLSISIGFAMYGQVADESAADLFRRADADMYEKKREFHQKELHRVT